MVILERINNFVRNEQKIQLQIFLQSNLFLSFVFIIAVKFWMHRNHESLSSKSTWNLPFCLLSLLIWKQGILYKVVWFLWASLFYLY